MAEALHQRGPEWTIISEPEHLPVLNALSTDSPKELLDSGFVLHPHDPKDYLDVRKCRRCKGKLPLPLIRMPTEQGSLGEECQGTKM